MEEFSTRAYTLCKDEAFASSLKGQTMDKKRIKAELEQNFRAHDLELEQMAPSTYGDDFFKIESTRLCLKLQFVDDIKAAAAATSEAVMSRLLEQLWSSQVDYVIYIIITSVNIGQAELDIEQAELDHLIQHHVNDTCKYKSKITQELKKCRGLLLPFTKINSGKLQARAKGSREGTSKASVKKTKPAASTSNSERDEDSADAHTEPTSKRVQGVDSNSHSGTLQKSAFQGISKIHKAGSQKQSKAKLPTNLKHASSDESCNDDEDSSTSDGSYESDTVMTTSAAAAASSKLSDDDSSDNDSSITESSDPSKVKLLKSMTEDNWRLYSKKEPEAVAKHYEVDCSGGGVPAPVERLDTSIEVVMQKSATKRPGSSRALKNSKGKKKLKRESDIKCKADDTDEQPNADSDDHDEGDYDPMPSEKLTNTDINKLVYKILRKGAAQVIDRQGSVMSDAQGNALTVPSLQQYLLAKHHKNRFRTEDIANYVINNLLAEPLFRQAAGLQSHHKFEQEKRPHDASRWDTACTNLGLILEIKYAKTRPSEHYAGTLAQGQLQNYLKYSDVNMVIFVVVAGADFQSITRLRKTVRTVCKDVQTVNDAKVDKHPEYRGRRCVPLYIQL